ncbi:signal peptidase, endoplasmic reticulum-type [Babesia microti strain RI]|uniref:Signal peptidase complex catalytic subunit SEC11 n=1 Tax=Babesia microti (strain RI) TaxID=1133968 RepID=I7JDY4_BABMR|nr:signal peptidase, endoplasmic reticulum-type [Babesia microti strain RI]CCF76085.1 signal peptidase, endoplasmic reticulum-type [Babesia microti strain RI]|eukprot:XP_012650493.1 signal peptidase, endoplasmic reticulum-type [Babesia microti strain RI]
MDYIKAEVIGKYNDLKDTLKQWRRLVEQTLVLSCVILTALMVWKFAIYATGTDSPVVVVLSGSMEPGFVRGDLLFLKKNNTINAGDIIVFKIDQREIPIVHRAMNVHKDINGLYSILTKGDNNNVDDRSLYRNRQRWLKCSHVLGTTLYKLPKLGMLTILLNSNPKIKLIAICLIIFAIASTS